ncbi:MAG: UvrD-helicase domain-containing protein [Candidatus Cloacimonas sp.]|jgi:ATP-dependent exoDNAse (exonuclease V) beta subunit|nr:UvrD-helicase domain-containing protein [Candidatus Cloacimonas sp.]
MPEFKHRIICASAGTGKTYRLSLEYIALLLSYYGQDGFNIDDILALTFTRKATAEIRDRILEHLALLLDKDTVDAGERANLLKSLRSLVPAQEAELSVTERNYLLSAQREIACDKSRLQVMTIDAYIGNIFRNIVRPLRNIESFEIDTQAIEKRMPFLMNHLMQPEFRHRLNKLLSRKVSRSLDDYAKFFASLIRSRWLFYMITKRLDVENSSGQDRVRDLQPMTQASSLLKCFMDAMAMILDTVNSVCQVQQKYTLLEYFNTDIRALIGDSGISAASIMQALHRYIQNPAQAEKLLDTLDKGNIYNGSKISKAKCAVERQAMDEAQQTAVRFLADYLMQALYVPEQNEIIELWQIILAEYDKLIYRYKNMTYDDISWFSFEALFSEDPPFFDAKSEISATEFYQFLSHRTRFLLIDEFQDTSLIQFNILKPIIEEITAGEGSKPFGGLIVVGDEKQSIFGWRGGQRDLLLKLNKIFPSLRDVQPDILDSCWRCGPTLMHFVNKLFQSRLIGDYLDENKMLWDYKMIKGAGIKHEPETQVEFCLRNYSKTIGTMMRGDEVYADFVARMVVPALEQDPDGSIAILCRKGNELIQIQQALDDCEISSLYQPDRSICVHALVSPLLDWLRFVAWGDWCDLLGFLRSDYLRINTLVLKTAVDIIAKHEKLIKKQATWEACDFSALPIVQTLLSLAEKHRGASASQACREIIDLCLGTKDKSEREYLNLHRFMNITHEWDLNNSSGTASIPDFLAYLSENLASEDFKQVSVSAGDSLQLLTIHKSKGLEFKRVFVFYNLSSGHRSDSATLSWAIRYAGEDFHNVSDFGISYHYQKILKVSSYKHLWEEEQKRELLEEMNNLYVALTRAKSKLHLYFCYEGKDAWADYRDNPKHENLPVLLCNACVEQFADAEPDARGVYSLQSIFQKSDNAAVPEHKDAVNEKQQGAKITAADYTVLLSNLPQAKEVDWNGLKKNDNPVYVNWKQTWLVDHPNLKGDLIHYYFSFIIRNLPEEHNYAFKRCVARYGSLLPYNNILQLLSGCHSECDSNAWLFNESWDKIYTEFELTGVNGLQRIDRLMLNTATKHALIIDFKSGEVHDKQQLESYRQTLLRIPVLHDYSVETRFVRF